MSFTHPPISSTFIFECGSIEEPKLEEPNKRTNKTKTALSTYFSSCQRLPWRWRPHLKAPFPLWLRHLGKGCQGNHVQANGKWRGWECNLPQDLVLDTYLHLHICINIYTISQQEREHPLQMNTKTQPVRKRNKNSLLKALPARCSSVVRLWHSSALNINKILFPLFIKLLQFRNGKCHVSVKPLKLKRYIILTVLFHIRRDKMI